MVAVSIRWATFRRLRPRRIRRAAGLPACGRGPRRSGQGGGGPGPVTLGSPCIVEAPAVVAFEVAVRAVREHVAAVGAAVASALPGCDQVVVIDEPAFPPCSSLGSRSRRRPPSTCCRALAAVEPLGTPGVHRRGPGITVTQPPGPRSSLCRPSPPSSTSPVSSLRSSMPAAGSPGGGAHTPAGDRPGGSVLARPEHRVVRPGAGRMRPTAPPPPGADHPGLRPRAARPGSGGTGARHRGRAGGPGARAGGRHALHRRHDRTACRRCRRAALLRTIRLKPRGLREQIEYYNQRYFVLDDLEISDADFDAPARELRALEEAHPDLGLARLRPPSTPRGADLDHVRAGHPPCADDEPRQRARDQRARRLGVRAARGLAGEPRRLRASRRSTAWRSACATRAAGSRKRHPRRRSRR